MDNKSTYHRLALLAVVVNNVSSLMHKHTFQPEQWPFEDPIGSSVVTTWPLLNDHLPILLVIHELSGGWQFLCCTTNKPEDCAILCFGCIYEKYPEISQFSDLPKGYHAWREDLKSPWVRERDTEDAS